MDKTKYDEMRETIDGALDQIEKFGTLPDLAGANIHAIKALALVDIAENLCKLTKLVRLADAVDDVWEQGACLITHGR